MIFFCKNINENKGAGSKVSRKMIFFDEIVEGESSNLGGKMQKRREVRVGVEKVRVNWVLEGVKTVKNVKVRVSIRGN
ncbi:MAG: hypothetical protein ABH864_06625 [archaeon]